MTSERAYATARSHDEAIAELRRCAGTQFDAEGRRRVLRRQPGAARAVALAPA